MKTRIMFAFVCLCTCLLGTVLADVIVLDDTRCPLLASTPCPFNACYTTYDSNGNPDGSKKYIDENAYYKVCIVHQYQQCEESDRLAWCNIDEFSLPGCYAGYIRTRTEWQWACDPH